MKVTKPWLALVLALAACSSSKSHDDLGTQDLSVPDSASTSSDLAQSDAETSSDMACEANAFVSCSGNSALFCNATGNGSTSIDCGQACTGTTGCGQCTPGSASSCANNTLTSCDAHGIETTAACVTLQASGNTSLCASGTACEQCVGAFVCGDGTNYGTTANTQYACTNGVLGTAKACAFGCDVATGECADLVPANAAGTHAKDTFTCTGTQSTTLPAVTVGTGDTLAINTSNAGSMTLNGTAVAGVTFGTAYTPVGSNTSVIVAHVKSLTATAGATINITGNNALALLVDTNVSITGAATGSVTVNLAATGDTSGGPGASSTSGTGGAAPRDNTTDAYRGGGGGAGHSTAGAIGGVGNSAANTTYGAAGVAYGAAEVLEAGSTGGTGVGFVGTSAGGYGGGALQISACGTVTIGTDVVFNASGGGGGGGAAGAPNIAGEGGGGGGSGGTIIIEGQSFTNNTLAGSLVANGGGGGQGGTTGAAGANGGMWVATGPITTPAVGGSMATNNTGMNDIGGAGGAGTTAPVAGQSAGTGLGGGGGGGATGSVFVNVSPLGTAPTVTSSSPPANRANTCVSGVACTYTFL